MALGYIVLTASYYTNVFNGRNLKWMSSSLFGEDGDTYDQTAVIDSNFHLNQTALAEVGLPRYTTTYAISQLCYNLSLGSAITYVFLWHWKDLKHAFGSMQFLRKGHADVNDPHYEGSILGRLLSIPVTVIPRNEEVSRSPTMGLCRTLRRFTGIVHRSWLCRSQRRRPDSCLECHTLHSDGRLLRAHHWLQYVPARHLVNVS